MALPRLPRRWRAALFDTLVAGMVVALALVHLIGRDTPVGLRPIGAAMAAALLLRRRYPTGVMCVVAVLALVQVLVSTGWTDPTGYDVAVLIAMYSVVKYGRRLREAFFA